MTASHEVRQVSFQKANRFNHGQAVYSTKLFTSYSHHCPSRPASGLRLETVMNSDKKKSELYFGTMVKKILTENVQGNTRPREKITP